MRYYRVRPGYSQLELDADMPEMASPAEEADVWPGGRGRPFVLVTRKAWRPPTDIYETAADVVIKMEVAGMSESSLAITIHDDLLSIAGKRVDETNRHKIGYHHMGISYGEFASEIQLPGPIDQDHVRAEYHAGFLIIWLPKVPPRTSSSIRVAISE
ncbi:MAG TPA: Hsp20/alpha crystallin family protein [Chloroflexia bacterium]|nr:Hsp20/alpha crystallin family protein [Chloroflexia bacterium]